MAQKNASPTKEQAKAMKKIGMNPMFWVVIRDLHKSMIVRHRITGEVKLVEK